MILDVFFVVFSFFALKQNYAGTHFTGASRTMPGIYLVVSCLSIIAEIVYLVFTAINSGIIHALVLFVVTIIVVLLINRIISKIIMNRTQQEYQVTDILFFTVYNHKCDISATVFAFIGLIVNAIIVILYFYLR